MEDEFYYFGKPVFDDSQSYDDNDLLDDEIEDFLFDEPEFDLTGLVDDDE